MGGDKCRRGGGGIGCRPVRWVHAVGVAMLLVCLSTPAGAFAASTSLDADRLEVDAGSTVTLRVRIDGGRAGDTIRIAGVALRPAADLAGDPAASLPEADLVTLSQPALVARSGAIGGSTSLVVQRGLYVFTASYFHAGGRRAFERRRSLVRVGGFPIDEPMLYDGLRVARGAVTGDDLQTLRAALGGTTRQLRQQDRTRTRTRTRTSAFRVIGPQGRYRGRRTKGLIVLVHGGGWFGGGAADRSSYSLRAGIDYLDSIALAEQRWNNRGYTTLNVDYHSGHSSASDVTRLVRTARQELPGVRLCFYGESAGGNISLLVAGRSSLRNAVRCVVNVAGPTDLNRFPNGGSRGDGPLACEFRDTDVYVRCLGEGWFGPANLGAWSPVGHPTGRRIIVAEAADDRIVPPSQGRALRARLGDGRVRHLTLRRPAAGQNGTQFIHGTTTASEVRHYFDVERAEVERAMR